MYFSNFTKTPYKFGNETYNTQFQNILTYVDIIDDIKDNLDFYQIYAIQNERPDQLSYKLYNTAEFYWTFFLMNDHIRRQGWPMVGQQIEARAKDVFSGTTVTTKDPLHNVFALGETVIGVTSAVTGTVSRRNADLGQIIIAGTKAFRTGELLEDQNGNRISIHSVSEEYNSAKMYVDGDRLYADIDPSVGPGALITEMTYMDFYKEENDKLKEIRVIKPTAINSVVSAFKEAVRNA